MPTPTYLGGGASRGGGGGRGLGQHLLPLLLRIFRDKLHLGHQSSKPGRPTPRKDHEGCVRPPFQCPTSISMAATPLAASTLS